MDYINKEENQNEKETESPLRLVFGDATFVATPETFIIFFPM